MTQEERRNVRNYLVNRKLQCRILIPSLVFMIIAVVITLGVVAFPTIRDMMTSDDIVVQSRSAQTFLVIMERLVPAVVFLVIIYVIHLLLLTHRMFGPFVNVTHTLDRLKEGDLTRKVYLRKDDYLHRQSDAINEMIDRFSEDLARLTEDQERLVEGLEHMMVHLEDDTREHLASSLCDVRARAQSVLDILQLFQLEQELRTRRPSDCSSGFGG